MGLDNSLFEVQEWMSHGKREQIKGKCKDFNLRLSALLDCLRITNLMYVYIV